MQDLKNGDMVYCTNSSCLLDSYTHGVFIGDANNPELSLFVVFVDGEFVSKQYVLTEEQYKIMGDKIKASTDLIVEASYTRQGAGK